MGRYLWQNTFDIGERWRGDCLLRSVWMVWLLIQPDWHSVDFRKWHCQTSPARRPLLPASRSWFLHLVPAPWVVGKRRRSKGFVRLQMPKGSPTQSVLSIWKRDRDLGLQDKYSMGEAYPSKEWTWLWSWEKNEGWIWFFCLPILLRWLRWVLLRWLRLQTQSGKQKLRLGGLTRRWKWKFSS